MHMKNDVFLSSVVCYKRPSHLVLHHTLPHGAVEEGSNVIWGIRDMLRDVSYDAFIKNDVFVVF